MISFLGALLVVAMTRAELSGVVLGPEMLPLPGALVWVEQGARSTCPIYTDAQGGFTVLNLEPGEYVVHAKVEAFVESVFRICLPSSKHVDIRLEIYPLECICVKADFPPGEIPPPPPPPPVVYGVVVDEDGLPLDNARLRITSAAEIPIDEFGQFTVTTVRGKLLTLDLRAPGFFDREIAIHGEQEEGVQVVMYRTCR